MKTRKSLYSFVFLSIGIVLLVNIVSNDLFFRLDLTENNRYTLSNATKDVVNNLSESVTVKAYFSENLPPYVEQIKTDFQDLLIEYANISNGNFVYEFINPNESTELEQEASQAGVARSMISVREKDQVKQQVAFLGAVIEMGEKKEVIPSLSTGESMEYALTSSIKKVSIANKPTIALIQGHGEPTIQEMEQVSQSISVLYEFEHLKLSEISEIPPTFKAIALVAPKDTINEGELALIDQYLSNDGKLLVALNTVEGDLQNATGSELNTGMADWLERKGITIANNFLVDASCATVNVQQQQGQFRMQTRMQFPYLPILTNFADHPITKGLEQVILPFASPMTFSGDTTVRFTPLAFSSDKSGTATTPLYFDIQKRWSDVDFPLKKQIVAATLEGNFGKIVVIGDGDFAVNSSGGGQPQAIQEDNLSLFVNAIDWLSDDTGLIELRTKGVTSRPIDQLEDDTRATLKWLNFALPILLIIVYGIVRSQMKRLQRIKRMEANYE